MTLFATIAEIQQLVSVLQEFVGDIDATGGVTTNDKGYSVLVADEDWVDLATTYEKAKAVLETVGANWETKR